MTEVTQELLMVDTDWPHDRFIKVTGPYSRVNAGGAVTYLDYWFDGGPHEPFTEVREDDMEQWFNDTGFTVKRHYLISMGRDGYPDAQSLRLFEFPNEYECSLFRIRFGF